MKRLTDDYKNNKVLLFVGAGVSKTLGLPTWEELINKIADDLDFDKEIFLTYGNYLALAEYYKLKKGRLGELRSYLDKQWHKLSIDISKSKIHEYIACGKFPIIYTTNYDNWIENAHDFYKKEYTKIVNVNDISKSEPSKKEIIKFHGDFSDDSSIVLTETSYYQRLEFETPLDIKLRSDILGKTVLFIGYSLNDINVRHLFYKLATLWNEYGCGLPGPRSYLFSAKYNPIQEAIINQWGIETINAENDDQSQALTDFMAKLTSC